MQDADPSGVEVAPPAERVDEPAEVVAPERDGHRVDREVAAEEVLPDRRVLDGRQRGRRVVELRARRDDVHAPVLAVDHDGRAELARARGRGRRAASASARASAIASPSTAMSTSKLALAEQDVADGAADEVDALVRLARGRDRVEDRRSRSRRRELVVRSTRPCSARLRGLRASARRMSLLRHDADERARRAEPRRAPRRRGEQPLQLGEAGVPRPGRDAARP